jgi:hypothetical protein
MFLVRFKLLISNFIVEELNVFANDAAEAAEKVSELEVTILSGLCGSRVCLVDVKLENMPLSLQVLQLGHDLAPSYRCCGLALLGALGSARASPIVTP